MRFVRRKELYGRSLDLSILKYPTIADVDQHVMYECTSELWLYSCQTWDSRRPPLHGGDPR